MKNNSATLTGLAGGILSILVLLFFILFLHKPLMGLPQIAALIIYVVTIIISVKKFVDANPDLGAKLYFAQGFKTFIVFAFMLVVFTFFYYTYDKSILEAGIKENAILLKAEGNRTDTEIMQNSAQIRKIFMPMMLSVTTIILLFLGAITSLACSFLFRKNKYQNNGSIHSHSAI